MSGDGPIFSFPIPRTPAAIRDSVLDGPVQRGSIRASLSTGNELEPGSHGSTTQARAPASFEMAQTLISALGTKELISTYSGILEPSGLRSEQ